LQNCYEKDYIDHFANPTGPLKEHDVRNVGLEYLLNQNIDYHLTWGSDEVIKPEEIPLIYKAAEKDPFVTWFRINYKNFVFDKQHYILGFTPARLFKVGFGDWKLDSYCWDDDVLYRDCSPKTSGMGQEPDILRPHTGFACKTIPNLLVDHYTWLNGPRSIAKIDYQRKHFGHCSYTYDENKRVKFDEGYYRRMNNSPLPEVYTI
jgi:hypothetical protein